MVRDFIATVLLLARHGEWQELRDFLALIRYLSSQKEIVIETGLPRDKP